MNEVSNEIQFIIGHYSIKGMMIFRRFYRSYLAHDFVRNQDLYLS